MISGLKQTIIKTRNSQAMAFYYNVSPKTESLFPVINFTSKMKKIVMVNKYLLKN